MARPASPLPPPRRWRGPVATLRTWLVVMSLLSTVPIALLMSWQMLGEVKAQQQRMGDDLRTAAANLARAVETELAAGTETLRVLAQAESLQQGDVARFQAQLRQRQSARPGWLQVQLLEGNARLDGTPADDPAPADPDAPRVSNLLLAGVPPRPATEVDVPVVVNGVRRYRLAALVDAARWPRLLQQAVGTEPDGSARLAVLADGRQRLLARSAGAPEAEGPPQPVPPGVGRPLPPELQPVLTQAPAGEVQRSHLPGLAAAYSAWAPVAGTGWRVGVAVPAQPRDQAQQQAVAAALATAALCLLTGVALALLAARRITEPLHRLATLGAPAVKGPIVVHEIALLRDALLQAQEQAARSHARLQRQADDFHALFSASPVGLAFAQGEDGRQVLHNPAMDDLLGAARPDGLPGLRMLAGEHELALADQPLRRACAGEVVPPTELELQRPDRPARHVIAQAVPLRDARGEPRGAIVAMLDITGRKQAEARLLRTDERLRESQRLVDLAQEAGRVGFFRYTWSPRSLSWTPGLARLFGLAQVPENNAIWPWLARIHADDRDRLGATLQNMLQERRERASFEFRVQQDGEHARWCTTRIQCSFDDAGAPLQVVGVTVDSDDQKRAEAQRQALTEREQAARRQAEAANRAKDELLAMLGHELRNPLSAIASSVEVLNRTLPAPASQDPPTSRARPPLAQEALGIISRQTRHLARLMDDLLDVGAVISGKVLLSRQPLDLVALVQRQVDTLALTGASARHGLHVDAQVPTLWVSADATRIEQVVNNLLSNALKYTPAGTRIDLRLAGRATGPTPEAGPAGWAELTVRDNGPGIPAALLPRVFDLFVQGERPLDRRSGGLGIGLTLVRRLVDLHGGHVDLRSDARGTVFTVCLPAIDAPAQAQAPAPPAAWRRRRPRRVVVVEDNEDGLQALQAMLTLDGHDVAVAREGHAGLALLLAERPEVGIVDIGLPGLTGYDLARRSRAAGYTGRLIALTGYGQEQNVANARRAGFDAHLVKPVDAQRLDALLEEE